MSRSRKTFWVVLVTTVVLLLLGWRFGWFASEPSYRGRTVTEWLDRLVLYRMEVRSDGSVDFAFRPPGDVANDPALAALLKIGPDAVPVLVKRIGDRANWAPEVTPWIRARMWVEWKWNRLRGLGPNQRPVPANFPEFQRARKNAAGLALLALGTNAGGGFSRYTEAYAAAPKHESIYGTSVAGPPVGAFSSRIVRVAKSALPHRRDEIFEEILNGLWHTNAWCRTVAIECVIEFPEELAKWKDRLAELTQDEARLVQEAALGRLVLIIQTEELLKIMPPSEIRRVAEAVLANPGYSERVRGLAKTLLGLANTKTEQADK